MMKNGLKIYFYWTWISNGTNIFENVYENHVDWDNLTNNDDNFKINYKY